MNDTYKDDVWRLALVIKHGASDIVAFLGCVYDLWHPPTSRRPVSTSGQNMTKREEADTE